MTRTARETVDTLYRCFAAGAGDGLFATLAADVDWEFVGRPSDVPFAGRYRGVTEMVRFFGLVAESVEVLSFGPTEIHEAGELVVSIGHERVRVRATDKIFETDWVHLFWVRGGKVARLKEFYDTASMAEAFDRGNGRRGVSSRPS